MSTCRNSVRRKTWTPMVKNRELTVLTNHEVDEFINAVNENREHNIIHAQLTRSIKIELDEFKERTRLQSESLTLSHQTMNEIQQEMRRKDANMARLEDLNAEIRGELRKSNERSHRQEEQLHQLIQMIDESRAEIQNKMSDIARLEELNQRLLGMIDRMLEKNEEFKTEIRGLGERILSLQKENYQMLESINELKSENLYLVEKNKVLQDELNRTLYYRICRFFGFV